MNIRIRELIGGISSIEARVLNRLKANGGFEASLIWDEHNIEDLEKMDRLIVLLLLELKKKGRNIKKGKDGLYSDLFVSARSAEFLLRNTKRAQIGRIEDLGPEAWIGEFEKEITHLCEVFRKIYGEGYFWTTDRLIHADWPDVRNVLDVGGKNGLFVLERSVFHSNEIYYIVDIEPTVNRCDTPQGVFNCLKSITAARALDSFSKLRRPFISTYKDMGAGLIKRRIKINFKRLFTRISKSENAAKYDLTFAHAEPLQYSDYDKIIRATLPILMKNSKINARLNLPISSFVGLDGSDAIFIFLRKFVPFSISVKELLLMRMPESMNEALIPYCRRIRFIKGDARRMGFPNKFFDLIFGFALPANVEEDIIKECRRVSKNNLIFWNNQLLGEI